MGEKPNDGMVMTGFKIGVGMFIVLPLFLICLGFLLFFCLAILGSAL